MLPPLYVVIVNLYEILKFILLYTISVLKQLSSTASKKPRIKPSTKELIFSITFNNTVINIAKRKPKKLKIRLVLLLNLPKSFRISLNYQLLHLYHLLNNLLINYSFYQIFHNILDYF